MVAWSRVPTFSEVNDPTCERPHTTGCACLSTAIKRVYIEQHVDLVRSPVSGNGLPGEIGNRPRKNIQILGKTTV